MSAYVQDQPWASVIKASATDRDFWDKEFEKPALKLTCQQGGSGGAAGSVASGHEVSRKRLPPPPRDNPRGETGARRADGRHKISHTGAEICYAWSRNADGCRVECPTHRAHVCEWCRQPHRTIECPTHPGWKPDQAGGGKKGGGKHAPSGKKRRRNN